MIEMVAIGDDFAWPMVVTMAKMIPIVHITGKIMYRCRKMNMDIWILIKKTSTSRTMFNKLQI